MRPAEVAELQRRGEAVVLLDVREEWEHRLVALPESEHIPLGELPLRAGELTAPEGATVVVYCHHGIRSMSGAAILQTAGWSNVASMAGGIDAWSDEVDATVGKY